MSCISRVLIITLGLIGGFSSACLIYVYGAFLSWEVDPGQWAVEGRAIAGLCMLMAFGLSLGLGIYWAFKDRWK